MKINWPGNKANETEEEIQAEVREPTERSSRSQSMKLENNIFTLRKVEVLRKDNMEEEALFPEEEEEPEEVKLDVMLWKTGHKSWECPERKKEGGGEAHKSIEAC
jgi:hypothetical protein